MKISALQIEQFMRVECVNLAFAPSGAITIAGDNGSGKTSVQTFLELCFGGKDKCPKLPVKVGAKKAMGKLTLDDEGRCVTVEVEVAPDRSVKAVVRQAGGPSLDSPMTLLKTFVSKFTFDPFALMMLAGQEQRRVMLDCLGVNFDDLEGKAEKIKEERKEVGRDRNGRERQINSMPEWGGVPDKELAVASLASRLQEAMVHNDKCRKFVEAANEWKDEVAALTEEQADLEAKLLKVREELVAARAANDRAWIVCHDLQQFDLAPMQKQLSDADTINGKIRANLARAALVVQFQVDHERYVELGRSLDLIEAEKQDRLNQAKCPIEGLEFRDDGVWYQGLPLSQDMESDQMIRSVQLAAALNPKLRTLCIDNGERMLPTKLGELNEWAEANDYQIILFRAAPSPEGCQFFLEEGKVTHGDE